MIINRRFRTGITNARWYIGTTGGNKEVFASFIRFTTIIIYEISYAAFNYVPAPIQISSINWSPMEQAVVV